MIAVPDTCSKITKDEVASEGVIEKEYERPPLSEVNGDACTLEVRTKSEARPVVIPEAPDTAIVHIIGRPKREGDVPMQARLDDSAGLPYTTKFNAPFQITSFINVVLTVIKNAEVIDSGVMENIKLDPPFRTSGVEKASFDEMMKSDSKAVVGPVDPKTEIVQTIGKPMREGLMPVQVKDEAEEGFPNTTNEGVPFKIEKPAI